MSPRRALLGAVAAVALAGCTGGGGPGAGDDAGPQCPNDLPAACPSPAPSYADDVSPVLAARCTSCHGPGGIQAAHDLTTYDGAYAERTTMLSQVYGCKMPPAGAPLLAPAERAVLLDWLVCDAPGP